MSWYSALAIVTAASFAVMLLLWLAQLATRKVALVDVGWSLLVGGSFTFYALSGTGNVPRRWLGAAMALAWAIRLGSHMLFNRVLTVHEDGRYAQWRQEFGTGFQKVMLAFFMAQALSVPMLAAPHLINANNPLPIGPLDYAASIVWLVGFLTLIASDHQLEAFKAIPANKGRVCDIGLWRYSRHPNYFGEWLTWVGAAVLASSAPSLGWLGWSAPVLMLLLITKVSGIPPAERQSLRSRGDLYRRYQQTTSAFVPLPPRTPSQN